MRARRELNELKRWRRAGEPALTSRYVSARSGLTRVKHGGHGDPTTVLIGGIGEDLRVWDAVAPRISEITHVLAYDRLGLGRSGPPAGPRDSAHIAAELKDLLDALPEKSPVVLVSHSAGAFHARMFAHRWPGRATGFVFVEPSHEDWLRNLKEADPSAWLRHLKWRNASRHSAGRKQELAAWDATLSQMRELGPSLPAVPTTIVSATAGHAAATGVLFSLHQKWLESLPGARHIVTDAAGHYIQKDAPEIVLRAIEETLDRIHAIC